MQEYVALLLNENNIKGAWYAIAAFIALAGIILNNYFENRRNRSDKKYELLRTAYMDAIDYIDFALKFYFKQDSLEGAEKVTNLDSSRKYYKLFLTGSAGVLDSFSKFSEEFNTGLLDIIKLDVELKVLEEDIKVSTDKRDNSLKIMTDLNDKRADYNNQKRKDKELWDLYTKQFEEANQRYELAASKIDETRSQQIKLSLTKYQRSYQEVIKISESAYNTILLMRNDIDRKLSKKERKTIEQSINKYMSQMKLTCNELLEHLQEQIDSLQNTDKN